MDNRYINLLFKSNNRELKVYKNSSYKLLEIEGIESGDYDIKTSDNANNDGCFITSRRIESRVITLKFLIDNNNNIEIERRRMISFFSPKTDGKLVVDYSGKKRLINYTVSDLEIEITENVFQNQVVEVELLCADPFFHEVVPVKVDVASWKPKFYFPLKLSTLMGLREPNLIATINNDGDTRAGIIVKFIATGTVVNPSFFNVDTREYFKINKTMKDGDTITVNTNTGHKTVVSNEAGKITNILNLWDLKGSFMQLDLGDNLFRYNADSGLENLDILLYFDPSYLGI